MMIQALNKLVCRSILREALEMASTQADLHGLELGIEHSGEAGHHHRLAMVLHNELHALFETKRIFAKLSKDTPDAKALMEHLRDAVADVNRIVKQLDQAVADPSQWPRIHADLVKGGAYQQISERIEPLLAGLADFHQSALREFQAERAPCRLPARPSVFLASTTAGIPLAEKIQAALQSELPQLHLDLWTKALSLGGSILGALEGALSRYQMAVCIIGPQDSFSPRRRKPDWLPRWLDKSVGKDPADDRMPIGNVILELGMFIGQHTSARAFLVQPDQGIPSLSDLDGLLTARYQRGLSDDEITSAVLPKLAQAMKAEMARG
ncbi:MAG TPA: hypothetical protein DIT64_12270 [Verrucomicrobiales bacterium]|nr:hypothetical protein [Verrucomicrobiales bacterium]HRJ10083.1 nucleotide-binding protein [Prosthecobacter sp.]HRK14272.1 nucleotide-binding protein [Prosthecobacter sp.]